MTGDFCGSIKGGRVHQVFFVIKKYHSSF